MPALDFPDVQHVTLSNGVQLHYAQRTAVPVTQAALSFNAGYAADAPDSRGLQNLTLSLLDEGTATRTSQQIAEEQERLGADISASGSADRSTVTMSALSANLGSVARPARRRRPQPCLRPARNRPRAGADRSPASRSS